CRGDNRKRVFLSVNGALLQRADHFWPGHRRRGRAERIEGGDVDWVFHGPQLQTRNVSWSLDGIAVVGDMTKTLFAPGERDETCIFKLGEDFLTDGTVKHGAGMGQIAEQEWNIEDPGIRHEIRQ